MTMLDELAVLIGDSLKLHGFEIDSHHALRFAAGVALQRLREPMENMLIAANPRGRALGDIEKWQAMIDAARKT